MSLSSTGKVLYGRHPIFPTDVLSMGAPHAIMLKDDYVRTLSERLARVHDELARIQEKLKHRMKKDYDQDRALGISFWAQDRGSSKKRIIIWYCGSWPARPQ